MAQTRYVSHYTTRQHNMTKPCSPKSRESSCDTSSLIYGNNSHQALGYCPVIYFGSTWQQSQVPWKIQRTKSRLLPTEILGMMTYEAEIYKRRLGPRFGSFPCDCSIYIRVANTSWLDVLCLRPCLSEVDRTLIFAARVQGQITRDLSVDLESLVFWGQGSGVLGGRLGVGPKYSTSLALQSSPSHPQIVAFSVETGIIDRRRVSALREMRGKKQAVSTTDIPP
jgi:hypothetical protein